jgi:hypothetical protein
MDINNFRYARKQKLEDKLQNSADLFPADADGAFAPPINSGEKSSARAINSNSAPINSASLAEIRAVRADTDRLRRRALWRRLDQLSALAWGCRS